MLIPTSVEDTADLAVPDPSYWCSTAAQYVLKKEDSHFTPCFPLLTFARLATISTLQVLTLILPVYGELTPTHGVTGLRMSVVQTPITVGRPS